MYVIADRIRTAPNAETVHHDSLITIRTGLVHARFPDNLSK